MGDYHYLGFGINRLDFTFEDPSFKQDFMLTTKASDTDISTKPDHLPVETAAGMLFLKMDDIAKFYIHNCFG
jgi:hypothetical protein